jgi:hypothetical protein
MIIWCVHDIIVWGICELVGVVQGYGLCEECKSLLPFKVVWVNNATKSFKLWCGLWNPTCLYMSNVMRLKYWWEIDSLIPKNAYSANNIDCAIFMLLDQRHSSD